MIITEHRSSQCRAVNLFPVKAKTIFSNFQYFKTLLFKLCANSYLDSDSFSCDGWGEWGLFIIHSHCDYIMYWICLHHTIRQIFSSCSHCKKSELFPVLPCSGSQYMEWKRAGNWSAFQQKALYIKPFNLMCWPRNSVVVCHFQGDCAWENSSISCITLTSLNQEKSLSADCRTLELSPAAAAWTPQIWAPCYLLT